MLVKLTRLRDGRFKYRYSEGGGKKSCDEKDITQFEGHIGRLWVFNTRALSWERVVVVVKVEQSVPGAGRTKNGSDETCGGPQFANVHKQEEGTRASCHDVRMGTRYFLV